MLKLAVVILNWNGEQYLQKFLPSVVEYSQGNDIEVVVIDNCSTDDSVNVLKTNFSGVRLICLEKNHGFANGYNKGLALIDAEYFVLLNSDVEVTANWIYPVLEVLQSDSSIVCAMPKLKAYGRKTHFEYAGAAGGYIDTYGFPFCKGRIFDYVEEDRGQYDSAADIFWATGAALFINADAYWQAGGLDGDFFAHMEEIDLCWRLKNMGKRIVYCPEATVYHVGGGTLPKENPFKTYLNFRNNLYLLHKNLSPESYKSVIFRRKILDGIAAIRFILQFDFKNVHAIVKAHRHYRKERIKLDVKRAKNLSVFVKYNHDEMFNGTIVFNFFIKGKKVFQDYFNYK